MHYLVCAIAALTLSAVTPVLADFAGPRYIPPIDLSSNKSAVSAAWRNATSTIQKALSDRSVNSTFGGVPGLKNVTFSLGLFSLEDPAASKFHFHYTSPEIVASNGTHKVDENSIYRTASITKVFTVLAGLLNLNTTDWDRSLIDVFPALAEYAKKHPGSDDAINNIQWDKITLSNLAAHLAGLPANLLLTDIALTATPNPILQGYPPVNLSNPRLTSALPVLLNLTATTALTAANYIPLIEAGMPNFLPWTQPVYSNNGFILLTAAIGSIVGKNLSTLSRESILDPLQMNSSFYTVPASLSQRSVIVNDAEWQAVAGITEGSGGLSSSINDLAKFGISILNSTLLPEDKTRKWLKPVSLTGRLEYSMGRPWEILRYTHASGAVTDLYTKAGNSGSYSSYLVIIPEYNAGFTILAAHSKIATRNGIVGVLGDLLANTIIPALEQQARNETAKSFAGTYTSTVQGLNSSVVLAVSNTESAAPGLLIKSFISNGTDFMSVIATYYKLGARLTPSILPQKGGKLAFRVATANDAPSIIKRRSLFSGAGTADFLIGDAATYGGAAVNQWVFQVGSNGIATSLSPTWLDVVLKKTK
ncbi:beta-lactamase/transpeptidase-like protein [Dendryphion nanum]|uniref:Beta-lactamase/transpeptidase-like protein n=1 Tax=Dendryphion nanum TaxID=256645 RepID=A0A9P9EJI8_9PLEO|nr:beta-lactamase/transpeptidase-like protein [Dendryphion nanum]